MADIIPYEETLWALREDVHVTLISHDADGLRTVFLVTRIHPIPQSASYRKPWQLALVLEFDDSGAVRINGDLLNSRDLLKWASLVDAVSLSPHFPKLGDYVTTRMVDSMPEPGPSKNY
jgi:hypothetical protein